MKLRERGAKNTTLASSQADGQVIEELEKKELFASPLNIYLTASFGLLAVQSLLFIFEGSFRLFSIDYKTPNYADHDHHLCHVLILLLITFVFWYFLHVVLVVRNREALNQNWALRFLGTNPSTIFPPPLTGIYLS